MDNLFSKRSKSSSFQSATPGNTPAGKASYDVTIKTASFRENDDNFKSKKKENENGGSTRTFFPISQQWQKEKATQFKIKVVKSFMYGCAKNFYDKTPPKEVISVEGDGNCFFRAISTCITGSENDHMCIREHITKHVEENPELYRTFLESRGGMNQYLTSMRRSREWATDVEILAAATLLKTIIEVYFPCRIRGHIEFRWQTFKPLKHPDITHPVIYLSNKNDHFDPVLDVSIENDDLAVENKHSEKSVGNSHNPLDYGVPISKRSTHESSFSRIHNLPSANYNSGNRSVSKHHSSFEF